MLSEEYLKGISKEEYLKEFAGKEDGFKYEYYSSQVIKSSGPSVKHQKIVGYMYTSMIKYFDGKKCQSEIGVSIDFKVKSEKESSVFIPDLSVFCSEFDKDASILDVIPDMVIEIWSEPNTEGIIGLKMDCYRKAGVKEFISVHMYSKLVTVLNLQVEQKIIPCYPFNSIVKSDLFSGLEFDLKFFV